MMSIPHKRRGASNRRLRPSLNVYLTSVTSSVDRMLPGLRLTTRPVAYRTDLTQNAVYFSLRVYRMLLLLHDLPFAQSSVLPIHSAASLCPVTFRVRLLRRLKPGTHWRQSRMSKRLSTKLNTFVQVERTGDKSNEPATVLPVRSTLGAFQWASRPPTGDQPVTRSQWNASG